MTLAIGDGGNDVNMIQKAHIGVGIFGKEGNQAAFASDYAISQFSFLWRLLLVHGRMSYTRTTTFINFFFYKNLIFTFPQFWFALYSGFSGQSIYNNIYVSNYNTIFTAAAPIFFAVLEQDIDPRENDTIRKALSHVYLEFKKKDLFSLGRFLYWWGSGVAHSISVFYINQVALGGVVDKTGKTLGLWGQSVVSLSAVFCTVFTIIVIGTNHFTFATFVAYVPLTLLVFFPLGTIVMDQIQSPIEHILKDVIGDLLSWVTLLLVVVVSASTVYIPKMYWSLFRPSLVDLLQNDRRAKRNAQKKPIIGDKNPSSMRETSLSPSKMNILSKDSSPEVSRINMSTLGMHNITEWQGIKRMDTVSFIKDA